MEEQIGSTGKITGIDSRTNGYCIKSQIGPPAHQLSRKRPLLM